LYLAGAKRARADLKGCEVLRPGITISHARAKSARSAIVRSDVAGFIAVVPKSKWPNKTRRGDFIEMPLGNHSSFASNPVSKFFDPVTRHAVKNFFENGGTDCVVFGLCIESEKDLMGTDWFDEVLIGLKDRLQGEEDLGILCMPVLAYLPSVVTKQSVHLSCEPLVQFLLDHCRVMNNRFLILDAPRDLEEHDLVRWVKRFRRENATNASYAAIYYPWLMNGDEVFPPSGAVAGTFARVDHEHAPFGVRWPPANIELRGVTHPAVAVPWKKSGVLNDASVNPILTLPGRGVVIWGARTLSTDPKWRYINSRRIVSFVIEQLRRDSAWVVFEHQRPELWETISRMVRSRLDSFWSAGMLTGEQAGDEYLIKCDAELNPPEVRDAGHIHVRVRLRPVSTAEFIEVELQLGG